MVDDGSFHLPVCDQLLSDGIFNDAPDICGNHVPWDVAIYH